MRILRVPGFILALFPVALAAGTLSGPFVSADENAKPLPTARFPFNEEEIIMEKNARASFVARL